MLGTLFAQGFVVPFVLEANGPKVGVVGVNPPAKALVNKDFVNQEVGKALGRNTKTEGSRCRSLMHHSQHDAEP